MHAKVVALSSALLLAGCVSAAPEGARCPHDGGAAAGEALYDDGDEPRDPTMFAARAGGTALVLVRVDGKYITGPSVSLGRYREGGNHVIRGTAQGHLLDLHIREDGVLGVIDNEPVRLRVMRRGSAVNVHGILPGRLSRFRIDGAGMRGLIGHCSYDLARTDGGFSGRRFCGGSASNFTLELPDTMASWTDADIAALIAVFLRRA